MFSSVRSRLTLWYAAVLGCTLLLLSSAIYWNVRRNILARSDAGLEELSDSFLATLEAELRLEARQGVGPAARQSMLEHQYPGRAFAVFDARGARVVGPSGPGGAGQAREPWAQAFSEAAERCGRPATSQAFLSLPGPHGGTRCYRRAFEEQGSGYVLVIVASLRPENELLRRLQVTLAWLVPVTIVLAAAGGYFLAGRNLAPVADMTARAERIGESTLHDRLAVPHPRDELGRLAQTFNRLLDRLDQAFERQRRFIADASHELRTPVAILQGESEVALAKSGRSPDEYRESLAILQHEARRLSRIVEDMFTLTRADAGQYPVAPRELYLDELVAECVQSVRTLAAAKSISLTVEADGELPAVADEALLSQLLLNLLDNAIKYTQEGGRIAVRSRSAPAGLEVAVSDNGPGIPAESQARIFERFFRADPARTRANSGGGAGLGLAIAKWIAEAHRGSLELTRSDASGTVFTLRLPGPPSARESLRH